ncbi:MAG TPA: VWA domain-containing protein [Pyrinomonadaceae bacterium]|nr:VWA domain-containing protein [Pyrinomonadaceae bacterium]
MLLTAAVSGFAQSGRAQPSPTPTPDDDPVKVATEEVKVNLLAFDEEGRFVSNVKEADLVITENNILHQATSVRRIPANVLIVMDTGGELRSVKTLDQTRKVARGVLNSLRKEDSVALLQYADNAAIVSEWTTDKSQMHTAINRTKFGIKSAFVDALKLAKEFMGAGELENKHLVLITDGTDTYADSLKKELAIRNLLSTDIAVHVISYTRMEAADIEPRTKAITNSPPPKAMPDEIAATLPNGVRDIATAPKIGPTINMDRTLLKKLRERKDDLERSEEMLGTLVENTNGTLVVPETLDEMEAKTATVAKMIDASYVLTYIPKVSFAERGGVRNIEITSKRPGLIVQGKRKFVVPATR